MAEAHAVELLHELDGVAGDAATHAVEESLLRADDEGRLVVLVERALAGKVLAAVFVEFHAARAHERGEVRLALDAVDFRVRDSGHVSPFLPLADGPAGTAARSPLRGCADRARPWTPGA